MILRKTAIMIVIFLLCLLCLIGCNHETADTDYTATQTNTKESKTKMTQTKETVESIIVDDLLECIDMLGKTAAEIGIPREAIDTKHSFYIATYINGNIFGVKGYADLLYDDLSEGKDDYLADKLWIYTKELNYDECKILLSEKFGESLGEVEIPYAQVNYGALTRADFRFQNYMIELSTASELDHISIKIKKFAD